MTPISDKIFKLVTTRYAQPFKVICKLSKDMSKLKNDIYSLLLPGMTEANAEGCIYIGTIYSNVLYRSLHNKIFEV